MATLYKLTEQAQALYELLQAEEIDEQTFADTLEAMGAEEKVESYCAIIRQLQGDTELFKKEADRITAREKASKNATERMKNALLEFMKKSGQSKIKAGTFSVSIGTSQSVNITDETKIPNEYKIPQPDKIDKTGIKAAIKEGAVIEGAEIVINEGVRIR